MSGIAYVNGRYSALRDAAVNIEDRGYQFADGVYEVFAVKNGVLIDGSQHLARLRRSLGELRMAWPVAETALSSLMAQVVRRGLGNAFGTLYLQITRGVAPRAHAFPRSAKSSLVMTSRPLPAFDWAAQSRGVAVISTEDLRWRRRDIKSVALLPNVMAKQQAVEAGAYEAWLVEADGRVTEATASNAWIVRSDNVLMTHPPDHAILNGITRCAVLSLARDLGLAVAEQPFTLVEAKQAREAFVTGTTSWIKPVVRIDDAIIGNGSMGTITERLLGCYVAHVDRQAHGSVAR